jgi:hypothetical protein
VYLHYFYSSLYFPTHQLMRHFFTYLLYYATKAQAYCTTAEKSRITLNPVHFCIQWSKTSICHAACCYNVVACVCIVPYYMVTWLFFGCLCLCIIEESFSFMMRTSYPNYFFEWGQTIITKIGGDSQVAPIYYCETPLFVCSFVLHALSS